MKTKKVIIILGGGNPIDGSFPEHARERVRVGIRLYRDYTDCKILFSGNRCPAFDCPPPNTEAKMMRAIAILEDIPNRDMWVEQASRHTIENALFTRLALESHGVPEEVLIVTSDFHMPRVKIIFTRIFEGLKTQLSFVLAKTTRLDEQNLRDKIKNELCGITRFEDFVAKLKSKNCNPQTLFEWKEVVDEFY